MDLENILLKMGILQKSSSKYKELRLNPYNPFSYLAYLIGVVLTLICFGVMGLVEDLGKSNPFKY